MHKLIRITTVPGSLQILLKGQHQFMSQHYEVVGVSSAGPALVAVQDQEHIRVVAVAMTRTISPLQDLQSLWRLYRFFKKEQPFIVHTHTPKAGTVGMLAAKLAGVPHRLHTVAGLPLMEATGNKRKLLDFVERLTYRCATKVYPNSRGLYDFILNHKFTQQDKLKVIANGSSNGINTCFFDPALFPAPEQQTLKAQLGIAPEDFVFVFVGRLVGDKGINELVLAFEKLHQETPRVKLLLVGALESDLDPLTPATLQVIASHSGIISVGYQKEVRPYFAISDVLVFPSYREGFPNVVMQAGAMGLPSIVSNINGCNEIIIEGENGTIIPVKDSEAIYHAMQKIRKDEAFRTKLQHQARPMIVSRYEQQVVWEAILAEYKGFSIRIK